VTVKKPPRPRTLRRAAANDVQKLGRKLDRLQTELPGGSPARPVAVSSASVVEVRARAERCLACDGELSITAHEAEPSAPPARHQIRRVDLRCTACRRPRSLWLRIEPPVAN
jgi:hypothetical protein